MNKNVGAALKLRESPGNLAPKKEVKSEGEAPQGEDPKKDGQETTNTNILNKLLQTILLSTF